MVGNEVRWHAYGFMGCCSVFFFFFSNTVFSLSLPRPNSKPFNQRTLKLYMEYFDFRDLRLDVAFRYVNEMRVYVLGLYTDLISCVENCAENCL
jgi:hypothetical protein